MTSQYNETTDYYELLSCDPGASLNDLKKAYRRAAMKWHPDRNHGNEAEATRVFQLIEHAYSILIDEHERAWYDGHRNMARDEDGEFKATAVDIASLFHACSYIGFGETKNGFYAVFRRAFGTLAEEENSKDPIPGFGNADSSWEEVSNFYAFWTCFTTKRSFAFNDIHRLRDAPNAMYRRYMSKENEKIRKKAEKEFVAEVRELAQFVKKRDPRVIKHMKEIEEEKQRKKENGEKIKMEKRRKMNEEFDKLQEENDITYTEEDLNYLHQFDKVETVDDYVWSCKYCNKILTKEAAFRSHCKTKKHLKTIFPIKKKFLENPSIMEHSIFNFILLGLTNAEVKEITSESIDLDTAPIVISNDNKENEKKVEEEEEEIIEEKPKQLTKKEKRKMQNRAARLKKEQKEAQELSDENPKNKFDNEEEIDISKLSKKERKRLEVRLAKERKQQQEQEEKLLKEQKRQQNKQKIDEENQENNESEQVDSKKNTEKKTFLPRNVKNPPPGKFMCRKCRQLFDSRRKLFSHLEETNHAVAE